MSSYDLAQEEHQVRLAMASDVYIKEHRIYCPRPPRRRELLWFDSRDEGRMLVDLKGWHLEGQMLVPGGHHERRGPYRQLGLGGPDSDYRWRDLPVLLRCPQCDGEHRIA